MRKFIALALVAMAIVALAAAPAFAEGYNSDLTGAGANGGLGQYTRAGGYFSGPHGGYTTTTNKCQDCHSTHYAYGSYKLLRANVAAAACDYCHGGGGGSTINVMMDNNYRTGFFDPYGADGQHNEGIGGGDAAKAENMDPAAIADNATALAGGLGTGHTLGFKGNAPADISPAFNEAADGLACFSCHSPHGNSARIMTTFSDPGRHFAGPGQAGRPSAPIAAGVWPIKAGFGGRYVGGFLADANGFLDDNEWGVDATYGNFVWDRTTAVGPFAFTYRPIWPSGRFLLLKNPHSDAEELSADTVVADSDGPDNIANNADDVLATGGLNKYKIDWNEPLGPADANYGGGQDNDNDNNFPFAPKQATDTDGNGQLDGGFLSASEFCVDCHDGAAGASTQKALVWNPTESQYVVAYSHDAQPRH